jgi:hypothetical protein
MTEYIYNNTPNNPQLLHEKLKDTFGVDYDYLSTFGNIIYVNMVESFDNEEGLNTLISNHNPSDLSEYAKRQLEKELLTTQVNTLYSDELAKATPDWDALYAELVGLLGGYSRLVTQLENLKDLAEDVYLITGIVGGSSRAKKHSLLHFLPLLGIYSDLT